MYIFEYLNLYNIYHFLFTKMNRIHLIIKTNLAVLSFPNAFLSFEKQEPKKRNKEVAAILETSIYNYIQNMSIYVHISFFLL